MSFLTKIFSPFVKSYTEASENVSEQKADEKALNAKLSSATGIEGVLDVLGQEKKSRKEKQERKAMRNAILDL